MITLVYRTIMYLYKFTPLYPHVVQMYLSEIKEFVCLSINIRSSAMLALALVAKIANGY